MEEEKISLKEIEELLSKYFKTQEQIEKEEEELEKVNFEKIEQEKILAEQEELELSSTLETLENVAHNVQYTNNILFVALVLSGVIVCWALFDKFLKIFI